MASIYVSTAVLAYANNICGHQGKIDRANACVEQFKDVGILLPFNNAFEAAVLLIYLHQLDGDLVLPHLEYCMPVWSPYLGKYVRPIKGVWGNYQINLDVGRIVICGEIEPMLSCVYKKGRVLTMKCMKFGMCLIAGKYG